MSKSFNNREKAFSIPFPMAPALLHLQRNMLQLCGGFFLAALAFGYVPRMRSFTPLVPLPRSPTTTHTRITSTRRYSSTPTVATSTFAVVHIKITGVAHSFWSALVVESSCRGFRASHMVSVRSTSLVTRMTILGRLHITDSWDALQTHFAN